MTRRLSCPDCGEAEELTGRRGEEGIRVTCDRCGASWLRDAAPTAAVSRRGSGQDSDRRDILPR